MQQTTNTSGRLLRVATALVGVTELEEVCSRALSVLERTFPGTAWGIFEWISDETFRPLSLSPSVQAAAGFAASPALSEPEVAALGNPRAWFGMGGHRARAPSLALGAWYESRAVVPSPDEVATVAGLLSAAMGAAREHESLRQQTRHDRLSGVASRGAILELLDREVARAYRQRTTLSVLYVDVDRFKQINDRFGHTVGDNAIFVVAQALARGVRACDEVGRLGGDEFLVVLQNTALETSVRVAARLAHEIAAEPLRAGNAPVTLSATFGAAALDEVNTAKELVDLADRRMLVAKRSTDLGDFALSA